MQVNLFNMDLYSCRRIDTRKKLKVFDESAASWNFGPYKVVKQGSSLLKENCALKVQVERNLDGDISRIGNYIFCSSYI